ncbi:MAG: nucleotidyltransferase domain-containing protein [Myxococcota bacterium]
MLPDWLAPALLGAAAEGDGEGVAALIGTLLGVPVRGLVLYGSLAAGRWTPASDIDVLAFLDAPGPKGLWGRSGDTDIDLHCVTPETDPAEYRHVANGRVLYDPHGAAAAFVGAAREAAAEPTAPMSREDLARERTWVARMLRRIRQAQDPGLVALYEAELITSLREDALRVRALPPQGAPATVRWMRAEAPEVAAAFDRWVATRDVGDLEAFAEVVFAVR